MMGPIYVDRKGSKNMAMMRVLVFMEGEKREEKKMAAVETLVFEGRERVENL
jgi:hypothetical protein